MISEYLLSTHAGVSAPLAVIENLVVADLSRNVRSRHSEIPTDPVYSCAIVQAGGWAEPFTLNCSPTAMECAFPPARPEQEGVGMSQTLNYPGWLVAAFSVAFASVLILAIGTRGAVADPSSSPTVGPGDQVPDLVMLPLTDFRLQTNNGKKVVRFTVRTENKGGTFDLIGSRPDTSTAGMTIVQNMHRTDGGVRSIRTNATMRFAVADGHDHWHVSSFAEYELRPTGSSEWRGAHKEGFCARDTIHIEGNAPRSFPNNCEPGRSDALKVAEGISTGWADRYEWSLWGQFIELDGLALPGDFCVAATADPLHLFAEAPRDNNTTTTLVRITAEDVRVTRQGC
jgi:hypothetical protein